MKRISGNSIPRTDNQTDKWRSRARAAAGGRAGLGGEGGGGAVSGGGGGGGWHREVEKRLCVGGRGRGRGGRVGTGELTRSRDIEWALKWSGRIGSAWRGRWRGRIEWVWRGVTAGVVGGGVHGDGGEQPVQVWACGGLWGVGRGGRNLPNERGT